MFERSWGVMVEARLYIMGDGILSFLLIFIEE